MVRTANLVGQSIIAYLHHKGYPDMALHFVKNEAVRSLNQKSCWKSLAQAAWLQSNHQVVEMSYQRIMNFEKISFLYLSTDSLEKQKQITKIAKIHKDVSAQYQRSLLLGDIYEHAKILKEAGQASLAAMTKNIVGIANEDDEEQVELNGDEFQEIIRGTIYLRPLVPVQQVENNWPLLTVSKRFFEGAMSRGKSQVDTLLLLRKESLRLITGRTILSWP
ncbi:GSCOCG00009255001-RA-CDS [Cotesia congregata]|nr:GSCOCG00009255001-RA-CDS [Cotesia congregata]